MHTSLRYVSVCALAFGLLSACSFSLEQKKIDYKSAGKAPSLEVPPDLSTVSTDDRFVVPDASARGVATYSEYNKDKTPTQEREGATILPEQPNVRVEREGSQRWLVVKATPEQVWPVVREFWQENGFLIKTEDPKTGIMETDWAENRAKIPQDMIRNILGKVLDSLYSTAERDKFRTRLEVGKDPGTTEIYISHRGMYEVIKGGDGGTETVWEPRPADPGLEAEFLRRLMARFGVEDARAKSALAKNASPTQDRAKLTRTANGASLSVLDPFDRAWRRVGLALDRVGFTVEDRDRSSGVYYVRYVDPEADAEGKEKKGWFSSLAFWRSNDSKKPNDRYQVKVADTGASSQVSLMNKDGAADKSETANKILNLLYEQLR